MEPGSDRGCPTGEEAVLSNSTPNRPAAIAALVVVGLALLFFWNSPLLWPLKITVVLFHELGHAIAAWVTGGSVVEIGLSPDQGGHTLTQGGFRLLILNAGYLGSLLFGVGLLMLSRKKMAARVTSVLLGVALVVIAAVYVRPFVGFGFIFTLITAAALLAMARWAPTAVTRWVVRGLGVFSVLYAAFDIRDDVFRVGAGAVTDATMLAELTMVPSLVWGFGWLIAGMVLLFLLRKQLV